MLTLKLKRDNIIQIGRDIEIMLSEKNPANNVLVSISAPKEIPITRKPKVKNEGREGTKSPQFSQKTNAGMHKMQR